MLISSNSNCFHECAGFSAVVTSELTLGQLVLIHGEGAGTTVYPLGRGHLQALLQAQNVIWRDHNIDVLIILVKTAGAGTAVKLKFVIIAEFHRIDRALVGNLLFHFV